MATYQFVIELIPEHWVKNKENKIEELYDDDLYDLSAAWQGYDLTENLESLFSRILPKGKSWSEDIQQWGEEKHNDIQLSIENNNIDSIKIRLSLQSNIEDLKMKITDLAKRLNCYFFIPNMRQIVKPDINEVNNAIAHSNAAKFVNDHRKFLDERKF